MSSLRPPIPRSPMATPSCCVQAREIALTVDGDERTVWTTALTVDEALAQFQLDGDVYVSASRSHRLPLDGTDLEVVSPRTVQFADNGAPAAPVRIAAPTVVSS